VVGAVSQGLANGEGSSGDLSQYRHLALHGLERGLQHRALVIVQDAGAPREDPPGSNGGRAFEVGIINERWAGNGE
jgi:hypothetical protein